MKTKTFQWLNEPLAFLNKKLILILSLFLSVHVMATESTYIPLSVTGFNADVICNSTDCTGSSSLDDQWFFYSTAKKSEGALPQSILSKMAITYNLSGFDQNNALTIGSNGVSSGILTLSTPVKAKEVWLLGLSASGQKDIDVVVQYTDNTTSAKMNISFPDWFQSDGSKAAYYGLGRAKGAGTFDSQVKFGLFERFIIVDSLKTIQSISFTYTGTDKTYTSIFAASAFLGDRPRDKELYLISNAHLDTQWDWDVQTTIDQYVKNTLVGNFNLFDKYPNYIFNFEGAIKYMFAKEYYPDLFKRLKGYVAAGRWHISGGAIDACDVMVPSAESIIRNFLFGHEFYKKEFGVTGGTDIMLPDCFGFPYSLPTLGKYCGKVGFHSQKLSWGSAYSYDALPHFGIWKGVDGSEIYAVHKPGAYVTQYKENMSYNGDVLSEIIANKEKLGSSKTVRYFGTGDRGGSVDESTADWLEKSLASKGPVIVKVATPNDFFESITPAERATLPVWDNELPMQKHGVGCYTSQAILKYWNRTGELLADATEKSSVLADWLGGLPYQSDIIRDNWTRILWHQFHDDLTGTACPKAYSFTYNDQVMAQLNFSKTLNNAVGAISRKLNTQVTGTPIVVYNPLSIQREDIVEASITVASTPENISVYNQDGSAVPAQIVKCENGVLSFIFKANVPSLGYVTYDLRLNDNASSAIQTTLKATNNTLENGEYVLKMNKNGDVYSILDKKQSNKELLKEPIRMSMQLDQPGNAWSWEISWGDEERDPYAYVDENVQLSLAENGPLRSALKVSRSKNGSQFVQYIRMTSGVNEDRIDFVNEVDWQTKATLLKVLFPLNASNPKAKFDLSIGTIDRGNRTSGFYEVAGHQWADITNTDSLYGVSILNNCKYGWDKLDDNTLRMTLIHTPKVESGSDHIYQQYQDLGLNKFKYSFYRHIGAWNESTQWQAAKLNQPMLAYETPKHDGTLGKSFELIKLNTNKVGIKALKKAEESDNMIVRVYELAGENQDNVEMTFPANIVSAKEVNGLEEETGTVAFVGNKITFPITKYQPKSFAVKLANYDGGKLSEPSTAKATLLYNIDVMSNDTLKTNAELSYAYPSELLSDEIVSDGIKFAIGPRTNGKYNATKCIGQEINIPQSDTNKKLYILASSQSSTGSTVDFMIDGVAHSTKVEYFAESVGQWGTVYASRNYKKENIAFTATHRHNISTNKNDSYSYLYIYKYAISIDKNAQKLTLPNDPNVIVFAVSASDNENDDVTPVTNISNLPEPEDIKLVSEAEPCASRLIPSKITASGATSISESRTMAADNNPYTKWCDNSSAAKWILYTFDKPQTVCQWNVLHAGIEGDGSITSDFTLQYYGASGWVDVDVVTGNTENKTVHLVQPFSSDKIRLKVVKGEQNGTIARIYSFDLFGKESVTAINDVYENELKPVVNHPNPFKTKTTISCNVLENVNKIIVDVYDIAGILVDSKAYPAVSGQNNLEWINNGNKSGLYFYKVSLFAKEKKSLFVTGKMIIL